MQNQKRGVADQLDTFSVPDQLQLVITPPLLALTGLPFLVDHTIFLKQEIETLEFDRNFECQWNIPAYAFAEAASLKKSLEFPLLYVRAEEKIRSIIVQMSIGNNDQHYPLLSPLNIEHVVSLATDDERNAMNTQIIRVLFEVYHYCSFKRFNQYAKKKNLLEVTKVQYPRNQSACMMLASGMDGVSANYYRIRTSSNSMPVILSSAGKYLCRCSLTYFVSWFSSKYA
jgi:hypothetical protein